MTHLDLFSGIGGFAIAAELSGFKTIGFSEINPYACKILKRHWPDITNYGDIDAIIEGLTGMPSNEYCLKHATESEIEVRHHAGNVFEGNVHSGNCELFQCEPPEHVENPQTAEGEIQDEHEERNRQPFLSRNSGGSEGTTSGRAGSEKGDSEAAINMPDMQRPRKLSRNRGAPSELQQALGRYVALPTMPSRLAHQEQGNPDFLNEPRRIDLITGGPPCQPASCAGQRRGSQDNRWFWPQTIAIVDIFRPTFCLFENPTGLLSLNGGVEFEGVLSKLESLGYAVQPIVIPAVAVDARHRRDRVWIIAHAGCEHRRIQQVGFSKCQDSSLIKNDGEEEFMGNPNGFSRRAFRPSEMETESAIETRTAGKQPAPVANAHKLHVKRSNNGSEKVRQESRERPPGFQGNGGHGRSMWQPEPSIRRVADGIPNRSHRLRCLGNAIVPAVAEMILKHMVCVYENMHQMPRSQAVD